MRAAEAALTLALTLVIGCHPEVVEPPEPTLAIEPPLPIDHGPAMPYFGTWVGPKLRLQFAGRWVLVEPVQRAPHQAPIELRVLIERREGDNAFALRTSIAGVMPADFLRPGDWTMLVEDGALALAMGDEPLERYERVAEPPPLVGPALIDPAALPEIVGFEHTIACLEFAGTQCARVEAEGPRALGCREAVWAVCIDHPEALAATHVDERTAAPMLLASMLAALRWSTSLDAAAPTEQHEAAKALHDRVLESAQTLLDELLANHALPTENPTLRSVQSYL